MCYCFFKKYNIYIYILIYFHKTVELRPHSDKKVFNCSLNLGSPEKYHIIYIHIYIHLDLYMWLFSPREKLICSNYTPFETAYVTVKKR